MDAVKSFLTLSSLWRTLFPAFGYVLEVGTKTMHYFKTMNFLLESLHTYFFLSKVGL